MTQTQFFIEPECNCCQRLNLSLEEVKHTHCNRCNRTACTSCNKERYVVAEIDYIPCDQSVGVMCCECYVIKHAPTLGSEEVDRMMQTCKKARHALLQYFLHTNQRELYDLYQDKELV